MSIELSVNLIGDNQTLNYAAQELKHYLQEISGDEVAFHKFNSYQSSVKGIWLGLAEEFSEANLTKIEDDFLDDSIYINIARMEGVISGSNFRSVLLSVYRFLTALGCRWVRPGIDGEYLPNQDALTKEVKLVEKPSYRHRGICIEGAVSCENVKEIVDWLPKVGLNSYYIQFREAYTFFDRWYSHRRNPLKKPEDFNVEYARNYVSQVVTEIKKRDLIFHAVGHGWTCEPFGIPGLGWGADEYKVSPEIKKYLAKVNGERDLWQGVPLKTSICFSNKEARTKMLNAIVEYIIENPEVDYLHFWLSDAPNNQCECENCRKIRPADFYVQMLNDLDELLTEKQLETKIVFLIYFELLWPPLETKIINQDRFTLMFAPISRTYREPFKIKDNLPDITDYHYNEIELPESVEENLSHLKAWQKHFSGDSFIFDYHYIWPQTKEPGYYHIARVLHADLQLLEEIGLNGYMSCQVQRAFFPNGLGMYVLGQTLWNKDVAFSELTKDYFSSTYGQEWQLCEDYLCKLSELFLALNLEKPDRIGTVNQEVFLKITSLLESVVPLIERNLDVSNKVYANSWFYLKIHREIWLQVTEGLYSLYLGHDEKACKQWNNVKNYVRQYEDKLQRIFDVCMFIGNIEKIFYKK